MSTRGDEMLRLELPSRPSELLRTALEELENVERDPNFRVDMDWWWWRRDLDFCKVCLAGAVMARVQTSLDDFSSPEDFDDITEVRLRAIDNMRRGEVDLALLRLGYASSGLDRTITSYAADPSGFKSDMQDLVQTLRSIGL